MKLLFDLFPVILFFATYKIAGHGAASQGAGCATAFPADIPLLQEPILLATMVAIAATFAQVGWLILRKKKVDPMLWISLSIIVFFGGATLYFRNPAFIQWKPTVLYWLFGSILMFAAAVLKKNLMQQLMAPQLNLPDHIWPRLNLAWAGFLFAMGGANLIAMKLLSCDGWVSFKLYGLTGLMFVFVIGQALLLAKYMEEEKI
ncbi:MAG: septation protein A [Rhodocyclaceae bacterium]|nr:MAG: septation protein A [Rhodocyclaceae bacterium]